MAPGPHVFGDDRLGIWVVDVARGKNRLASFKGFGITDVFMPAKTATRADLSAVRTHGGGGLNAHLWRAVDGMDAKTYADTVLQDISTKGPGAYDLNMEFSSDAQMERHVPETLMRIRAVRPKFRLRVNIAPRKWPFIPTGMFIEDDELYVTIQNYGGNQDQLFSAPDMERGLRDEGIPDRKISTCYGAMIDTGDGRVPQIPNGWAIRRGVIFQDDLMADAGYWG